MADLTIGFKVPEYVVAKMADDLDQFDYGAAALQERLLELLSQAVSDYNEQRQRLKFCADQAKRSARRLAEYETCRPNCPSWTCHTTIEAATDHARKITKRYAAGVEPLSRT